MRDTTLAYVSLAPIEKIERYKAKKGWTFPWYSSFGSDFNRDFGVTSTSRSPGATYNFRAGRGGASAHRASSPSSSSCFLRVDDRVFHTYSSYARGGGVDSAAPTRSSTSRRSAARRTGRSRRAARRASARPAPNFLT